MYLIMLRVSVTVHSPEAALIKLYFLTNAKRYAQLKLYRRAEIEVSRLTLVLFTVLHKI